MRMLLPLFFLFLCYVANAQTYQSVFGKEGTSWVILEGFSTGYWFHIPVVAGDTIANGHAYKILRFVDSYHNVGKRKAYIRESSDHSKLWYAEPSVNDERLIMDLGLKEGDSFFFSGLAAESRYYPVTKTTTDSSLKRVEITIGVVDTWQFGYDTVLDHTIVFKEGSGPLEGLFYQHYSIGGEGYSELICHRRNDSVKIKHTTQGYYCWEVWDLGVKQEDEDGASVYPSLVKDKIVIEMHVGDKALFSLFDLQGKKLISTFLHAERSEITFGEYASGLYLYTVELADHKLIKGKVIKE